MSNREWRGVGVQCSAIVVREYPDQIRGVLHLDQYDASAVFAPDPEEKRIVAKLAAAGIEVLDTGHSLNVRGGYTFAAVVQSKDVVTLRLAVAEVEAE